MANIRLITKRENILRVCYDEGHGVAQSYTEAVKYYKLAANQGDADAQYNLALCYEYGQGVAKSISEAVKYYKLAADQGDEAAQKRLRELGY